MTNEQCAICGGTARLVHDRTDFKIGNRSAVVVVERYKCDDCQETYYAPGQAKAAFQTASDAIRQEEGLLGPSAVRAIRAKRRLSQAQMERLLELGPKTFVRWEQGTIFQTKAADQLLRCLDAVPGVFEFFAARAGIAPSNDAANAPSTYSYKDFDERRVTNMKDFLDAKQTAHMRLEPENEMPLISEEAMK